MSVTHHRQNRLEGYSWSIIASILIFKSYLRSFIDQSNFVALCYCCIVFTHIEDIFFFELLEMIMMLHFSKSNFTWIYLIKLSTNSASNTFTYSCACFITTVRKTIIFPKNAFFWDVTPCGSSKNRRFGGTYLLNHQDDKNQWTMKNLRHKYQLTQCVSIASHTAQHPKNGILQSQRRENLKSYIILLCDTDYKIDDTKPLGDKTTRSIVFKRK
jgi:hypothetical protein